MQPHSKPWIVGFSGGKDSTLLAHLVLECLLAIPPDERKRRVFILSNDTLVESPVFQAFVNRLLDHMTENIPALRVPVEVIKTSRKLGSHSGSICSAEATPLRTACSVGALTE